jgi:hypothetical protein
MSDGQSTGVIRYLDWDNVILHRENIIPIEDPLEYRVRLVDNKTTAVNSPLKHPLVGKPYIEILEYRPGDIGYVHLDMRDEILL